MRAASIALALLLLLGAASAAQAERGGRAGGFTFGGAHRFTGAHRFAPVQRFARRRPFFGSGAFGSGAPFSFFGPGFGYWGDMPDYWDWGGMPAGYGAAPTVAPTFPPPPRAPVGRDERDERASIETTPQGVTIIRGPGSRHIER